MRSLVAALCAAAVTAGAAPVRAGSADDLAAARAHKTALEWDQALVLAERALADGDADPARVRALHQLAGELAAGLGQDDVAIAHFEALLALAPDAALPPGTSPKITARFDDARARAAGRPAFAAHVEADPAGAAVVIDADPLAMAAGARARYRAGDGRAAELAVRGGGRLVLALPPGAVDVELAVVDAHGNALWRAAPPGPAAAAPAPAAPASWTGVELWGAAAGLALAAGGLAAWRFRTAQDEWDQLRADSAHHDYSELAAVETRGRRWAIAADVGLGAAAVAATITVVLAVRHPRRADADDAPGGRADDAPALTVAPALTPGGLGVALGGRF